MACSLWPHRFGESGADVASGVDTEVFDGRRALALGELERPLSVTSHVSGNNHHCINLPRRNEKIINNLTIL